MIGHRTSDPYCVIRGKCQFYGRFVFFNKIDVVKKWIQNVSCAIPIVFLELRLSIILYT